MHPLIAEFPSWRFYGHRLETGIRPQDRLRGAKPSQCLTRSAGGTTLEEQSLWS